MIFVFATIRVDFVFHLCYILLHLEENTTIFDAEETEGASELPRPSVRGDCLPGGINEARPCPFILCKYNLYLDITKSGRVILNTRGDVGSQIETCALDVADKVHERGESSLEDISFLLDVTPERVRQMEKTALVKIKRKMGKNDGSR